MTTLIYSVSHFLVDFLCAWGMFRFFQGGAEGYRNFLVYNFCAFALQLPLGTVLDLLQSRRKKSRLSFLWAGAGALLTGIGTLTHPALLGLGNALFHVGGGMDVIGEDNRNHRRGRDLGIFVAPGAIGLYMGTLLGKGGAGLAALLLPMGILAVLLLCLFAKPREDRTEQTALPGVRGRGLIALLLGCFAVVVLRSFTGFTAVFPWKSKAVYAVLSVLAVACGKAFGGFLYTRFGEGRSIALSLGLAAVCFLLGDMPGFGILALLFFNMSMPVTLYLLAKAMPELPGFAFGLLTFGLFLGFLPVYAGLSLPLAPTFIGAAGSLLSAAILLLCRKAVKRDALCH